MTLAALTAIITSFGLTPYTVETESHIYAFSLETAPGTFGHPKAAAAFSFESGYLIVNAPGVNYEKKIICDAHGDNECPACTGAGLF